jgi:hypothetical protein
VYTGPLNNFEDMRNKIGDLYGQALVNTDGSPINDSSVLATAVENLENSLHYVRTYRIPTSTDGIEKTGIEIQFQCDYDENAGPDAAGCNLVGAGNDDIAEFEEFQTCGARIDNPVPGPFPQLRFARSCAAAQVRDQCAQYYEVDQLGQGWTCMDPEGDGVDANTSCRSKLNVSLPRNVLPAYQDQRPVCQAE